MNSLAARALAGAIAMTCAGCATVGPDFVAPHERAPASYSHDDPSRADAGGDESGQRIVPGTVPGQ
ncbi:MAG TPA: hypothetical protein VN089_26920, partial [Duganella sp.]|nr:hypothetical protein [Duganella sp.]